MRTVKDKNIWVLKLKRGEEVIKSLTEFIENKKIKGAHFSGIRAVQYPELGYFDIHENIYLRKQFCEAYEVIQLSGNIGWDHYNPVIHCHVALGGPDYTVIGGHLFNAVVSVTMEIFLYPLSFCLNRIADIEIPLKLMDL